METEADAAPLADRVLSCQEQEFDVLITNMGIQDMIETIGSLQGEMEQEQVRFEELGKRLADLDPADPKHEEVTGHLVVSQTRLAMLASRNMKCFSQQMSNQNEALKSDMTEKESVPDSPRKSVAQLIEEHSVEKADSTKSVSPTGPLSPTKVGSPTGPAAPQSVSPDQVTVTVLETSPSQQNGVHSSPKSSSLSASPPDSGVFNFHSPTDGNRSVSDSGSANSGVVSPTAPVVRSYSQVPSPPSDPTSPTMFTVRSSHAAPALSTSSHSKPEPQESEQAERINFAAARSMFEGGTKNSPSASSAGKPRRVSTPTSSDRSVGVHVAKSHENSDQNGHHAPGPDPKRSNATVILVSNTQENGKTSTHNEPSHGTVESQRFDRPTTTESSQRVASEPSHRPAEPTHRPAESARRATEPAIVVSQHAQRVRAEPAHRPSVGSNGEAHVAAKPKAGHHKTWMQTVTDMGNKSCTRVPRQDPDPYLPAAPLQSHNEVRSSPQQRKEVRPAPQQQKEIKIIPLEQQEVKLQPQQKKEVRSTPQHHNEARSSPQQHILVSSSLPTQKEVKPSSITSQEQHFVSETKSVVITNASVPQNAGISSRNTQQANNETKVINHHVNHDNAMGPGQTDTRAMAPAQTVTRAMGPGQMVTGEMANGISVSGQSVLSKPVHYDVSAEEGFTTEDIVKDRVTLQHWDPTKLQKDVYAVTLQPENAEMSKYINMEGYMEKLPQNKTKATLLKTWKRRFFKAKDGILYYYENAGLDHATGSFQLMGGSVEDLGNRMLGVDDGRGRYLITRCPTDPEFLKWKRSLDTQTIGNISETYVKPILYSPPHSKKKVVIIDLGSCSVRAGLLGEQASLPSVFFPTAVATHKVTGAVKIGFEVLRPEVRLSSTISFPVRPTPNVDKFTINMEQIPPIFEHVFKELKIDPKQYLVMLSSPARLSDHMKGQLMDILVSRFNVAGANIVNQTILSLYSYSASSGIVVDIGERLEIVPITDGYVVDGGVSRQPYGGHRIADHLNATLAESKYHFFTHVDFTIVRKVMEELCYVSQQYEEDIKEFDANPAKFKQAVKLDKYNLPDGFLSEVCSDVGRFRAAEGLFNLSVWGMDNPPLHKLVQKAVQACPMDTRREMWRSIYLSGGVTKLPGFCERLQAELMKIVPGSIVVQVHASPHRYHAAYIGACVMAGISEFERSCITAKEWREKGNASLTKWQLY